MAEFENARKRTAKEATQRYDMGAMGVLEKLLPVIDNFERGLEAVSEEEKDSAFVKGIEQIYKPGFLYDYQNLIPKLNQPVSSVPSSQLMYQEVLLL